MMEQQHPNSRQQAGHVANYTHNNLQHSAVGMSGSTMNFQGGNFVAHNSTFNIALDNAHGLNSNDHPDNRLHRAALADVEFLQNPRKRPRYTLEADDIYNPGFATAGYGAPAAQWQTPTIPQPQPYWDQPLPAYGYAHPAHEGFGNVSTTPFDIGHGISFNTPLYMPTHQYASYAEPDNTRQPQYKQEHAESEGDAQDDVPSERTSMDGSPLQSHQVEDDPAASLPTVWVSMHIPRAEPSFFEFSVPANHPLITQGVVARPAHYDRQQGLAALTLRSAQTLQAPSNSNPQTAIHGGAVQPAPPAIVQPQATQGASSAYATPSTTSATPPASITNPALVQGPTYVSDTRRFTVIQLPSTFSDGPGLPPADSDMIKEALPVRSLNKLATAWRKHQGIAGGHEMFDRLPTGYHLYKKKRVGGNGVEKVDPWIVGHPRGNFKSIPKFIPHFIHIMRHRNSDGCACELCGRGRT